MAVIDLVSEQAVFLPLPPMTYEQFLKWTDEDARAEWVRGHVLHYPSASATHQRIKGFLLSLLMTHVEDHDAGEILMAPFQMFLPQVPSGREPDILYIAKANLSRLTNFYLDGPATLAVEIVSPESRLRDRSTKYAEYEQEGVREYWLLDPELKTADFFVLGAQGRYEAHAPTAEGIYHSAVLPGFWMNVQWLWQDPLPTGRQVRREWEIL